MDEKLDPSSAITTNHKLGTVGGPVTCVSLPSPNLCLYSQGSGLERVLFLGGQQQRRDRHLVFSNGVVVHGIRHANQNQNNESLTAVFGGRQVALIRNVLPVGDNELRIMQTIRLGDSPFLQCSDWIWQVQWLPDGDKLLFGSLLVGLAHNTVELYTFSETENDSVVQPTRRRIWRGAKRCLTYCLDFYCFSGALSIAVGSAMQDIRIWKVPITEDNLASNQNIVQEVTEAACIDGHQGVIHAVKWVPGGSSSQLVSASDDRSIRLWQQQQQQDSWQCLWIGWGHTARIWGLGILLTTTNSSVIVVTTGEDGTTRLWQDGKQVGVMRGHACQCIWSVDTHDASGRIVTGANDGTVALHNIRSIGDDLAGKGERCLDGMHQSTLAVPDDRPPIKVEMGASDNKGKPDGSVPTNKQEPQPDTSDGNNKKKKKKKKKPDPGQLVFGMKFYSSNRLVVATRTGTLFSVDTVDASRPIWKSLGSWAMPLRESAGGDDMEIPSESGCSLACHWNKNSQEGGTLWVSVGTTQGVIVVMTVSTVGNEPEKGQTTAAAEPWKITERFVMSSSKRYRSVQGLAWISAGSTLVDSQHAASLSLLSFHINTVVWWHDIPSSLNNQLSGTATVLNPKWILDLATQAIPISFALVEDYKNLFVGDTRGNLVAFHLDDDDDKLGDAEASGYDDAGTSQESAGQVLKPSSTLTRLHQKEHVTDLVVVPIRKDRSGSNKRILSVGNDGCINESYFDIQNGSLQTGLSVVASSALTGIAQVWVSPGTPSNNTCDEDLIVAGYYGNTFVVLNVSRGYELFRTDTGGRQRLHDFWSPCLGHDDCGRPYWEAESSAADSNDHNLAVCIHRKQDGRNDISLHQKQNMQHPRTPQEGPLQQQHADSLGVGLHGETIYSAGFFPYSASKEHSSQQWALLTGSEDCGSKIAFFEKDTLVGTKRLPPQESCVRAVCSSTSLTQGRTTSLLAVGGGKLTLQFFLVSDIVSPEKESRKRSVVVGDAEVRFLGYGRSNQKTSIDHRINSVISRPLQQEGVEASFHVVAAGDSQGKCHIYKVDLDAAANAGRNYSWMGLPLPANESSRKPILSLELIPIQYRLLLLIGTTGGDVELWDLPAEVDAEEWEALLQKAQKDVFPSTKIGVYRAHQMGTNSISATVTSCASNDDKILICSGGDDQAISVCKVEIDFDSKCRRLGSSTILHLTTVREASSSAIKGVSLLDESHLLSVGYSQRLALWKIMPPSSGDNNVVGEDDGVSLLWMAPASVGDVNCMRTEVGGQEDKTIVAVCGAGVDLFTLPNFADESKGRLQLTQPNNHPPK